MLHMRSYVRSGVPGTLILRIDSTADVVSTTPLIAKRRPAQTSLRSDAHD